MSDQSENINCSSVTSKLLDNLLTLPIELSTSPSIQQSQQSSQQQQSFDTNTNIFQSQQSTTTMPSLTVGTKGKSTTTTTELGSISVPKKQSSPSTPSTAIDFFTFKWLFKKRAVPFLKKSSSSIFPEASDNQSNQHHGSNSVNTISSNGNGLDGSRSNSRSAGSRLDCQSIPGTAKPTSKICSVTQPFISRLTETESTLKSTLRMKLSYSFGDIDDFSKWSYLDNGEKEPLNPDINDDHSSLNHPHNHHHHPHPHNHLHHHRNHSNVNTSHHNSISSSSKCLFPKSGKLTSSSSASISHLPSTRRSGYHYRHESSIGTLRNRELDSIERCSLCLNEISPQLMHTIWSCGCRFCINCLQTYLTINIKENNNVCNLTCPDSNCPEIIKLLKQHPSSTLSSSASNNNISSSSGPNHHHRLMTSLIKTMSPNRFTPQEIQLLVPEETFNLYKKYKLYQEVDEDPNRTWCPKPNCVNICTITKCQTVSLPSSSSFTSSKSTQSTKMSLNVSPELDKASFYCQKCNETYCNLCRKPFHPGTSCWPSGEDDDLALLLNNQSGSPNRLNNIKRCPRCSVWIERDDGCAQMMCRKCKHVFCWFCLQSLEDDFLLRHYDKGPCKNKLGHSRPSVIWHRTQVIAIFAGFGLLLLLASPLFLIASPCILCCNCCCGSSCKYLDDGDPNEEEDGFGVVNL